LSITINMRHRQNITGAIYAFLLAGALIMMWYGYFILHANHYFISPWGDGFKNYYTFAYYVAYDHGAHFTGMNYPFGEHVIFTDDQPALAFIARYAAMILPHTGHLHAIFIWCMYLSLPVCAAIIFLIFSELGIGGWYAIISAVLITLLSPQMDRIGGHYGLSYCFVIPFTLWALIRYFKAGKTLYLILLVLFITFFGLIHMYHLAILSAFLMACAFIWLLISSKKNKWVVSIKLFIASVLPFAIIKTFLLLTDSVKDRPDNPWGFFDSCVTYDTVFLEPNSFIYHFIARHIAMPLAPVERWAYIGIAADILLILFLLTIVLRFSIVKSIFKNMPESLPVALIASVILLLFSFGLPFTIHGCQGWFDHIGPLKQFRAPCRFAWVFYYLVNIFLVVYFYNFLNRLNTSRVGSILLACLLFTLWFIDINVINNQRVADFHTYGRMFDIARERDDINALLASRSLTSHDFQAALYLPYFSSGSEKTSIVDGSDMLGMKVSLFTGLGLPDVELSRTSLYQTDMNLQLMSSDLIAKKVLALYSSQKPLILIVGNGMALSDREKTLITRSSLIGKAYVFSDSISLYSIPLTAFADSAPAILARFNEFKRYMTAHGQYMSTDTCATVIYHGYDEQALPYAEFGQGALYMAKDDTLLYKGKMPNVKDSAQYEFSVWNYSDHRVCVYPSYRLEIYRGADMIKGYDIAGYKSTDVYGKWLRNAVNFTVPDSGCIIKVNASGSFATYDEMMIRPLSSQVLTHVDDKKLFMYNNYPILRQP
jgi:hypothetical protein